MENESVVTERICKIIHKNVDEKFEALDSCMKDIRDVMTELREIAAGNKEIISILMEERKSRKQREEPDKTAFWDTKTGQLVPWLTFALFVVVIAAIAGVNLLDAWDATKDVIKIGG